MNIQELREKFNEVYGEGGDIREYFAPGRVNLIGEHTDYNGGHVFPCALTIGTYGVARKRDDDKVCFMSANIDNARVTEASLSDLEYNKANGWANYPLGVVWAFDKKGMKLDKGFDMIIWGNIPNGSGLSSSASLEVLTGVILQDLYGFDKLTMTDLALIGQYSENNYNGCNCGIMDQFAVANGKKDCAIFLDTSDLSYEYANINLPDAKIVITNSKVKHSLVDGKYNERRQECAKALEQLQTVVDIESLGDLTDEEFEKYKSAITDPEVLKRAKHAVAENQRTIKAVKALADNDVVTFGQLMNQSHISLRDDYKVSCEEVDVLVDLAWSVDGVIGSRITGGGFGGCTVSIVKNEAVDNFVKIVGDGYKEKTGIEAEFYIVDIGDGARRLS
ncbi:MAG: galactokinase [Lachnospiraceae bacterium]|nr:galactokinase [Lachnospiraceae bacterium]MBQ1604619.1 galactokinase [Lachnospiraceae bacterium]MBQ2089954.1 galactokinase [Lachnospiraceae bacterium]MBQ4300863.1 galactokinase [Lachnospiraceae bacterium]MCR5354182.1 galactokinase [Lachnospiraceae bacterium]